VIVGNSNIGFGNVAFIWDTAHGMRDLRQVLIDEYGLGAALENVTLTDAVDISADGRVIVGLGYTGEPGGSWIVHLPPAVTCYPNCDGSMAPPILNVLDFNCFLNRFAAGEAYANCDGSVTPPVLNVLDFNCFLNRFTAGCP
jgi:hypothetical protein